MKKMFITKFGSEYYLTENGFWTRKKYNGEMFENYIYLGSINPLKNTAFKPNGNYYSHIINPQFTSGKIPGFIPDFKVGYCPFGVKGIKPGDVTFSKGKLHTTKQAEPDATVIMHIGDIITEVFV